MGKIIIAVTVFLGILFTAGCGGGEGAQTQEEATESAVSAAVPLHQGDPLYAMIQRFNDAATQGDLEALKEVVAKDCQIIVGEMRQSYWDVYTEEYVKAIQETQTTSTVEEVKVIERTDDQVTVQIVAESKGKTGGGRSTSQNVFRKYDGKWKLAETEAVSVSFSTFTEEMTGRIEDRIPTEAFAQHVKMYPGTQFTETKTPMDMGSGPLFGVDKQVLSCVQGTTPDSVTDVTAFYRNEMKGNWQNFRQSTGGSVSKEGRREYIFLTGEKTQPDGKRIGTNIKLEKEGTGTRIIIVMGPLGPEKPAP